MFIRMIFGAIMRQKTKFFLIFITIFLATALTQTMLMMFFDVSNKVNQELKTYGANITLQPKESSLVTDLYGVSEISGEHYLSESDIPKLKTIFWAYNIKNFVPLLTNKVSIRTENGSIKSVVANGTWFQKYLQLPTGETIKTGLVSMKTWWKLSGQYPKDTSKTEILIGRQLSENLRSKIGDTVTININNKDKKYTISGISDTGDSMNQQIFLPLSSFQEQSDLKNLVTSIDVSAITTPDNDLARKAAKNPKSLTIKEWETWYCTAYVSSISYQIEEAMPNAKSKVIRQVADSEGIILNKIQILMLLLTGLGLISAMLGISSIITTSIIERHQEIGLIKAIGGSNASVVIKFIMEILLVGGLGGLSGGFSGFFLSGMIGREIFGTSITLKIQVIPIVIILILFVILIGSVQAIYKILKLKPDQVLRGGGL